MKVGVVLTYLMIFLYHHGWAVFERKIVPEQLSIIYFNTAGGNIQAVSRPKWLLVEKPKKLGCDDRMSMHLA